MKEKIATFPEIPTAGLVFLCLQKSRFNAVLQHGRIPRFQDIFEKKFRDAGLILTERILDRDRC